MFRSVVMFSCSRVLLVSMSWTLSKTLVIACAFSASIVSANLASKLVDFSEALLGSRGICPWERF